MDPASNSGRQAPQVPQATSSQQTPTAPQPPVITASSAPITNTPPDASAPTVVTAQPFSEETPAKRFPLQSMVIPLVLLIAALVISLGGFLTYQHLKKGINATPSSTTPTQSSSAETKAAPENAETNPGGIPTTSWSDYSDTASKIAFRLPGPLLSNNPNIPMDGLTAVTYEADYQGRTVASVVVIADPQNIIPVNEQSVLDFEAAKYNSRLGLSVDSHNAKNFDVSAQGASTVQNKSSYQVTGETLFNDASAEDGILIDEFSGEIIDFGQYKVIAECHGTDADPSIADPVRDAIATTLKL